MNMKKQIKLILLSLFALTACSSSTHTFSLKEDVYQIYSDVNKTKQYCMVKIEYLSNEGVGDKTLNANDFSVKINEENVIAKCFPNGIEVHYDSLLDPEPYTCLTAEASSLTLKASEYSASTFHVVFDRVITSSNPLYYKTTQLTVNSQVKVSL